MKPMLHVDWKTANMKKTKNNTYDVIPVLMSELFHTYIHTSTRFYWSLASRFAPSRGSAQLYTL